MVMAKWDLMLKMLKDDETECPFCGEIACCEMVDIGVGFQQATPFQCGGCFSSQMGPLDKSDKQFYDVLTDREKEFGWIAGPDVDEAIKYFTEKKIKEHKYYNRSRLERVE